MSPDDDDLERRLRSALTSPRTSDQLNAEDFLSSVHRGAKVRRAKRGVSVAAAAVLVVAGGGLALNVSGVLSDSPTPIADGHTSSTPPITPPSSGKSVPTTPSESSTSETTPEPTTVSISPGSAIAAEDVKALSLTATGTLHQWVLGETPGGVDCTTPKCATVFSTETHGDSWQDLGQLPAPPASSDLPTPSSVSQLRFAKRDGTETYDGWAFGNAYWSTHDSGQTWSSEAAPPGQVTQLEATNGYVYAGVSSAVEGDDTAQLYRSPVSSDTWATVPVGKGLTSVQALAAANGVLGLIDSGGLHSALYVSPDGASWSRDANACPTGFDPQALSTATDPTIGLGSLWVTCSDSQTAVIRYMETDDWGNWHQVLGAFAPGVMVAARTPTEALVAGGDVTGIEQVSSLQDPAGLLTTDVGSPLYFGFTNDRFGYLLNTTGDIISTGDPSSTTADLKHWPPYVVSDTQP